MYEIIIKQSNQGAELVRFFANEIDISFPNDYRGFLEVTLHEPQEQGLAQDFCQEELTIPTSIEILSFLRRENPYQF